jgi:hypothetical protein
VSTSKENPLGDWGGISSLAALGGIVGLGTAYLMPMLMKMFKEKTMTPMEKAFAQLLKLLLGKLEEQDAEIEKLRKRPTEEAYKALTEENAKLGKQIRDYAQDNRELVDSAMKRKARGKKP